MNWIKCSDQMPEKNLPVLAWFPNGAYPIWAVHYDQEWCGMLGQKELIYSDRDITHWQPINPPQA
jgi:hypothetical protein